MLTPQELVKNWLDEIAQAEKREKHFRQDGRKLVKLYEAGERDQSPYNILYANTETLGPALYNSVPRPIVQRRFKDADPLGKLAAHAGQRILEYLLDDGMSEYETFDDLMKASLLPALVPGRGAVRFKYEAEFRELPTTEEPDESVEDSPADAVEDAAEGPSEEVTKELVCGESVAWDNFLHGFARKWKDVPWVAYRWDMTMEELRKNFPAEIVAQIKKEDLVPLKEDGGDDETSLTGNASADSKRLVAPVYEIWDKASRKVIFVSSSYLEGPLKAIDDPLGLSGFFSCPKPLTLVPKLSNLTPVALYFQYEAQAKELNRITTRINRIVAALKVRGGYDASVEGMEKILEADDNVLLPINNMAALSASNTTLEKALWLVPIEKLVAVLQQLYTQRESVKQVIFELTGIADIMRGASQASETFGAQKLKNKWGTLRMKRMQNELATYARDSLRIMLEIAVNKLSEDTIRAMTGLPYPTQAEKEMAGMQVQEQQALGQQPPEELYLKATLPSWAEVLGLLRSDLQRSYRIDIETNSTVDAEATEDKEDIAEVLSAISQFLTGVSPLVQSGSMPFEVAQGMLLTVVRKFRFGSELEDQLQKMKPPTPPDQGNNELEAAKQQAELEKIQLTLQVAREKAKVDMEKLRAELEADRQRLALDRERMQMQMLSDREAHQRKLQEAAMTAAVKGAGKRPGVTRP